MADQVLMPNQTTHGHPRNGFWKNFGCTFFHSSFHSIMLWALKFKLQKNHFNKKWLIFKTFWKIGLLKVWLSRLTTLIYNLFNFEPINVSLFWHWMERHYKIGFSNFHVLNFNVFGCTYYLHINIYYLLLWNKHFFTSFKPTLISEADV